MVGIILKSKANTKKKEKKTNCFFLYGRKLFTPLSNNDLMVFEGEWVLRSYKSNLSCLLIFQIKVNLGVIFCDAYDKISIEF